MSYVLEKLYSIEISRLKSGANHEKIEIDRSFFAEFKSSQVKEGNLSFELEIQKYMTHLDVTFQNKGYLTLECDRCTEPYRFETNGSYRVIYAYDEKLENDKHEVVIIDRKAHRVPVYEELYDMIHLQIPMRRVPDPGVHTCPDEVLKILEGTDQSEVEENEIDPRWNALKKLKEKKK